MKLGLPIGNQAMQSAYGKVTAIDGKNITIETNFFVDEKADGVGNTRTVTLASNGKINILSKKSAEEFTKDQQAYQKLMQSYNGSTNPPSPPSTMTSKNGNFSDIAVGDTVSVQANSDIRLVKDISATEIDVMK